MPQLFLAFRYVVDPAAEWVPGIKPDYPEVSTQGQIPVETMVEIEAQLRAIIAQKLSPSTGILLSGGIDSAILAALLPRGTRAYTIKFNAAGFLDESIPASVYAKRLGLRHAVVPVDWADYAAFAPELMRRKKSPLHAIEVALHKAALAAKADGLDVLIVGNGADSTFGGMDKLLSRDWTLEDFYRRYTFVDPFQVLRDPVDLRSVYRLYLKSDGCVDVQRFLKTGPRPRHHPILRVRHPCRRPCALGAIRAAALCPPPRSGPYPFGREQVFAEGALPPPIQRHEPA